MPSPTTARGLLGHFMRGVDPPAVNQRVSPPPVRSPISSFLWAIPAAGAGVGGARGDVGRRGSPRDGGGEGRGAGGEIQGRMGNDAWQELGRAEDYGGDSGDGNGGGWEETNDRGPTGAQER